ncbi:hypothetical protein MKX01_030931 [Papaver californicum]|nr:hypothetical protein MKX01_030931 [Papaver californicum]
MALQLNCTPPKVGPSATQDMFKSLRYLQEGRSSSVTVRVSRKWEELEFLSTNDVTSVDMVIVDEEGAELYAVIPRHHIWKFDNLVREGCLFSNDNLHLADAKPRFRPSHSDRRGFFHGNTTISELDVCSVAIVPNKSCFSEFEALAQNLPNLNLTADTLKIFDIEYVYGYLKTISNLQSVNRSGVASCRLCEITLENIRGSTVQISLRGPAVSQLSRCPFDRPPRHITVPLEKVKGPAHVIDPANRKTISQLSSTKWDSICRASNVIICNATPLNVNFEAGWHYIACPRCSKRILDDDGDLWCTGCESKVPMPIARFLLLGTSEENARVALVAGFSQILHKPVDF